MSELFRCVADKDEASSQQHRTKKNPKDSHPSGSMVQQPKCRDPLPVPTFCPSCSIRNDGAKSRKKTKKFQQKGDNLCKKHETNVERAYVACSGTRVPKPGRKTKKFQQKGDSLGKITVDLDGVPEYQKKLQQNGDSLGKTDETNLERDIPGSEARQENLHQVPSRDKCGNEVPSEKLKDWHKYSMYASLKDRVGEEGAVAAAEGAAVLAHKSFSCICWTTYEDVFSADPDAFKRVRQAVLKGFIKYVLTLYDLEDFIRIGLKDKMYDEGMKFIQDLIIPHKTAVEAILAIADGKMERNNFGLLRECDVGYILKAHMADDCSWSFEDVHESETLLQSTISVMKQLSPLKDVHESKTLLQSTISVMKQLSPLKRNCAMHLRMELIHKSCRCIFDTLLLEFWRDINLSQLDGCHDVSETQFDMFVIEIRDEILKLVRGRVLELLKSMESATFPLRFRAFGSCTVEVIDVVDHAECGRRLDGHHFIGTRHLLLGLLCSRIAASVEKFLQFGHASEEPSIHPPYDIYKKAEFVATFFGDAKIGLEHLFLAIMFVKLGIPVHIQLDEDQRQEIREKGLTIEEFIAIVQEQHMCSMLGIDLGKLDTKLLESMESATLPLRSGAFGACTVEVEVIEVVAHAECERRLDGDRFIGTHHILLGLLRSRIAASVEKFVHFGRASEEPSIYPLYDIFKTAAVVASKFGVENIELEHLFLASLFVKLTNRHPQLATDLRQKKLDKGLTMEEFFAIGRKQNLPSRLGDLGNLDKEAFARKSLAPEEETWDAARSTEAIDEFYEAANNLSEAEKRLFKGSRAIPASLFDFVMRVPDLCKSYRLPIIWENDGDNFDMMDTLN